MPKIDLSKTAQERHNHAMSRALRKRQKMSPEEKVEERKRVEALLAKKSAASSTGQQSTAFDPIETAMKRHRGLTRERAEELAEMFGF